MLFREEKEFIWSVLVSVGCYLELKGVWHVFAVGNISDTFLDSPLQELGVGNKKDSGKHLTSLLF